MLIWTFLSPVIELTEIVLLHLAYERFSEFPSANSGRNGVV